MKGLEWWGAIAVGATVGGVIALGGQKATVQPISELALPTVKHECRYRSPEGEEHQGFAGLYVSASNTIYICRTNINSEGLYRYTLAHELAHWRQQQQGRLARQDGQTTNTATATLKLESEADYWAVNALLQRGDCGAIGAYAQLRGVEPPYQPGVTYAQSVYRRFCQSRYTAPIAR